MAAKRTAAKARPMRLDAGTTAKATFGLAAVRAVELEAGEIGVKVELLGVAASGVVVG